MTIGTGRSWSCQWGGRDDRRWASGDLLKQVTDHLVFGDDKLVLRLEGLSEGSVVFQEALICITKLVDLD